MIVERVRQDAHFVETIPVYSRVFQVHAKNSGFEIAQRLDVVHLLPNEMRRIVVQAEIRAWNFIEHTPPESGARPEIFAARPFIAREQHGAILDGDADAVVFSEFDQVRPYGTEAG